MPSRIDIGPEGGPFVAINENSNDLELQDINGNVIAVWDETEGQWDLNNNSLTNINAIDASSATLGNVNLLDVTGDGLPAQAIDHGKVWADDGQLYDSPVSAYDAASSIIIIGPGTFSLSEPLLIDKPGTTVRGCGRSTLLENTTTTNDNACIIDADKVTLESFALRSVGGFGNKDCISDGDPPEACQIKNLWIEEAERDGIRVDFIGGVIEDVWCDSEQIGGNDIELDGDSSRSVADAIIGTVVDSGTANTVGDTA